MPIEIIIREDETGGVTGGAPAVNRDIGKESQGQESESKSQTTALLIDYGKEIMQNGITNFVDYSGNYLLNQKLQNTTNIAADGIMLFKGGAIGATAVAFKTINTAIQTSKQISRQNQTIEFARQQAGKIIEYGGRYTND